MQLYKSGLTVTLTGRRTVNPVGLAKILVSPSEVSTGKSEPPANQKISGVVTSLEKVNFNQNTKITIKSDDGLFYEFSVSHLKAPQYMQMLLAEQNVTVETDREGRLQGFDIKVDKGVSATHSFDQFSVDSEGPTQIGGRVVGLSQTEFDRGAKILFQTRRSGQVQVVELHIRKSDVDIYLPMLLLKRDIEITWPAPYSYVAVDSIRINIADIVGDQEAVYDRVSLVGFESINYNNASSLYWRLNDGQVIEAKVEHSILATYLHLLSR